MTRPSCTVIRATGATLALLFAAAAGAQEFRRIQPIPTPVPEPVRRELAELPKREVVEAAVSELFAAWNTPTLSELLSEQFYEQTRLPDALATKVPRDATIRILALESYSALAQTDTPLPSGKVRRITTVSVIVRSQIEYNDAVEGFQRVEGSNEYIFDIKQVVEP